MIQAVTELPPSHTLLPFEDKSENWAFADPMSGAVRLLSRLLFCGYSTHMACRTNGCC
eukprot:COSAG02_NODE_6389_length_3604_cov_1.828531_2_plen_58_part_00